MKAILQFNIPEEESEYCAAINGTKFYLVCLDMDTWLRNKIKHVPEENPWSTEPYEQMRDCLHELMDNRKISLDMIE